jgi:L-iditol 2-dehydrogenase
VAGDRPDARGGDGRLTNHAAVLTQPGEIVLEERAIPEPGPREVLVKVTAVGVCGSDVHYYEHGRIGDFVVRAPLILGHESAGRVAAVGAEVTKHAVGDRVTLEPGVPCGHCRDCRAGRYNLCPDVVFFATPRSTARSPTASRSTRTSPSRCPSRCPTMSAR